MPASSAEMSNSSERKLTAKGVRVAGKQEQSKLEAVCKIGFIPTGDTRLKTLEKCLGKRDKITSSHCRWWPGAGSLCFRRCWSLLATPGRWPWQRPGSGCSQSRSFFLKILRSCSTEKPEKCQRGQSSGILGKYLGVEGTLKCYLRFSWLPQPSCLYMKKCFVFKLYYLFLLWIYTVSHHWVQSL